MRFKINLNTESDVRQFVEIATSVKEAVWLTDSQNGLKVNGKSLLGVLYTMADWDDIYVESERDLYFQLIHLAAE